MSSKLAPWRALRSLSVRTRPRPLRSCPEHQQRRIPTSVLAARRGLSDDMTTRGGSDYNDNSIPPPPPPPPQDGGYQAEPELEPLEVFAPNFLNAEAIAALQRTAAGEEQFREFEEGLIFDRPVSPTKNDKLQDRYHPVVHQITRLLMKDGKLSKAQRHMSMILNYLRMSPAPKLNPLRPLLPGAPPPEHLPLNPLLYLTLAVDSVAPLIRIKAMKGMAGGGQALEVPEPIPVRVRRRTAVIWILDIVNKKPSRGSGRGQFAARFGEEIVAVVEGRSRVWDKRQQVHKLGTVARANLMHPSMTGRNKR